MRKLSISPSVAILWYSLSTTQLVNCSRHVFPTATAVGRGGEQTGVEPLPTANPWSPSEILKRLSGDPAICGWVDGNGNDTVSCNSGYSCAARSTFVGCCSTGAVGCEVLFTTCYDALGPSCDAACSANSAALICGDPEPYCATYQYASGSQGYGCAAYAGYNKTVLTTTTLGATPFGQSATTTTTSSISSAISTSTAPATSTAIPGSAATVSSTNLTLINGGAIAGAVAGAVVVIAVLVVIFIFVRRRVRTKRNLAADASRPFGQSYPFQDRYVYAQYSKPDPAFSLASMSLPSQSRHLSGWDTYPLSEHDGRSLSPGSTKRSPAYSEISYQTPAELAAIDGE